MLCVYFCFDRAGLRLKEIETTMPIKKKVVNTAAAKKAAIAKPNVKKAAVEAAKVLKPKAKKAAKAVKLATPAPATPPKEKKEQLVSSEVVYEGRLFRVLRDRLIEPGGKENTREIVRHNGSVVILAIDSSKSKKDPWIVMERQYRHAAQQFLWELPAGKLEAGEEALLGAQRELEEETGYRAKKWRPLMEYYASPGFLGESMKLFLAEGLVAGDAHPEDDEQIEIRLAKLSEVVKMIDKGAILDGKTLSGVLFYARQLGAKRKK
jgi:ADP-ribose pyrophosphatase